MSEGRSVASRLSLVGFAYLLLFLPFFGFLSPKSAGVIVPLATVLILSGWLLDKKSLGGLRSNVWWVVLAIGGLVTIGVVRAPDTDIAIDRLLKLAVFLPGGILLVLISAQSFDMRGEWSRKCLLIGFGLGMILLAWAVLSFGPLGEILPPSLQYIQGFSGENRGAVLLVGLTTAAFLAARNRLSAGWIWAAMATLGALLLFAASQTAFVAFFAWLAVYFAASLHLNLTRQVVVWGGALFIVTQPFLVLVIEWLDPSRSFDIEVASVGARLDIWIAVAHKAMEAPILGHGIEATRSIQDWTNGFFYFSGRDIPHPHNGLLQIWIEMGLAGALMAAFIWVAVTRAIGRISLEDQSVLLALASCILVIVSISHGLWQSWWLWGVFGVVAATFTQMHRADLSLK